MATVNDSATGGPLLPDGAGPTDGQALNRALQQWIAGVLGLSGTLVRPTYQSEPPDLPTAGTAWVSFRYTSRPADAFPYLKFIPDEATGGSIRLERDQLLELSLRFYDLGTNGEAETLSALFRDGVSIAQNCEPLLDIDTALVVCGEPIEVPVLVKTRWQYRVDMPVELRRRVRRTYPVRNVLSFQGTLYLDDLVENLVVTVTAGLRWPSSHTTWDSGARWDFGYIWDAFRIEWDTGEHWDAGAAWDYVAPIPPPDPSLRWDRGLFWDSRDVVDVTKTFTPDTLSPRALRAPT